MVFPSPYFFPCTSSDLLLVFPQLRRGSRCSRRQVPISRQRQRQQRFWDEAASKCGLRLTKDGKNQRTFRISTGESMGNQWGNPWVLMMFFGKRETPLGFPDVPIEIKKSKIMWNIVGDQNVCTLSGWWIVHLSAWSLFELKWHILDWTWLNQKNEDDRIYIYI